MRTNIECLGPYQLDPAVFCRDVSYETVIAGMFHENLQQSGNAILSVIMINLLVKVVKQYCSCS